MRTRNSIWNEMQRMQEEMDFMFSSFFNENPFYLENQNLLEKSKGNDKNLITKNNYRLPMSDFYESNGKLIAEIEMPGLKKQDIKVNINDNVLEISAEKNQETKSEDKKKGFFRLERNYSGYCRNFRLPKNVDEKNINAEYKDGILKVTIPKTKMTEQKKKLIEVK